MANIVYTNYLRLLMSGHIDLLQDSIRVMLLSGSYTPNTGHHLVSSVIPHQAWDLLGSYVSGGQLLVGRTLTDVGGDIAFDASDVSWSSSTITASGAVLWNSGAGGPTNHHLIAWIELGNQSSTNGVFQIVWNNSNGIFKIGDS